MRHRNSVLLALVAAAGLALLAPPSSAWGLAGKLDRPSISTPVVGDAPHRVPDPICSAMQKALSEHAKQFVGGRFINAHSVLEFSGATAELNALLRDLAAIEGAKLHIRFAKGPNDLLLSDVQGEADKLPYHWRVEHNAWADAQYLSITILVGDGKIKVEEVQLPTIVGQ